MVVPLKRQRGGNFQNSWSDPDEMNIDEVIHFCNWVADVVICTIFIKLFAVVVEKAVQSLKHMLLQHRGVAVSVVINWACVMCLSVFWFLQLLREINGTGRSVRLRRQAEEKGTSALISESSSWIQTRRWTCVWSIPKPAACKRTGACVLCAGYSWTGPECKSLSLSC